MSEGFENKLWLNEFMGHEEIQCNPLIYDLEKNIDTKAIIFTNQQENEEIMTFIHKICQACGLHENTYTILNTAYPLRSLSNAFPSLKYIFNYGFDVQQIIPSIIMDPLDKIALHNTYIINVSDIVKVYQDATTKAYYWNNILKPIFSN